MGNFESMFKTRLEVIYEKIDLALKEKGLCQLEKFNLDDYELANILGTYLDEIKTCKYDIGDKILKIK